MNKKQAAKFFCESCGAEVAGNSKFCKNCGRFFASVRCPICGETGSNEKFKNGCPNCGYTVPKTNSKNEKNKLSRTVRNNFISAIDSKNKKTDGSLPIWSYFLILLVFLLISIATYYYLKNS